MKQSEMMWGIFVVTGNIEAYLLYLDCIKNERSQDGSVSGGILDLS